LPEKRFRGSQGASSEGQHGPGEDVAEASGYLAAKKYRWTGVRHVDARSAVDVDGGVCDPWPAFAAQNLAVAIAAATAPSPGDPGLAAIPVGKQPGRLPHRPEHDRREVRQRRGGAAEFRLWRN
jgi:hypothetical protein